MLNIINNILSSNGYANIDFCVPQEVAEIYIFSPSDLNSRQEYFITARLIIQSDVNAQAIVDKIAQELFEKISQSGKVDSYFEKNCTLLLCHEEDKIKRQTILAIEEDQYNFKKNVITYNQQELKSLQSFLAERQIDKITNSIINSIISSDGGTNFLKFKENHKHKHDYYSLILKTALKLPFITYIHQEQELNNLDNEIKSSLTSSQLLIYNKLVESESIWTEENIYQQIEIIWGS